MFEDRSPAAPLGTALHGRPLPLDAGLRPIRAAWRLLRCAVHVVQGLTICALVFPLLGPSARRRRIEAWSRGLLAALGLRLEVHGTLVRGPVLLACNHVSWLDIVALQAVHAARFVSKAEVARWPLVGMLVRRCGTILVDRARRRDAHRVVHAIAGALRSGRRVAIFPEGTTGTGRQVLPFHANLLEAAIGAEAAVQPVAIRHADAGASFSDAATFVGTATLLGSLWRLACADGVVTHVTFCTLLESRSRDRRALAAAAHASIQARLDAAAARP
jgi:1-acyl-sn-glycerol-3-phosphate acyltransferase